MHRSPMTLLSSVATAMLACAIAMPAAATDVLLPDTAAEPAAQTAPMDAIPETGDKASLLQPLKNDHMTGNPHAPVVMIEYASLSCGHCASFYNDTYPELKEKYIDTGKLLFIYRHFPLNEPAMRGAMLTECADDKFNSFLKVLFKTQNKWAFSHDHREALRTLASVGGMSGEKFDACLADKHLENKLVSGLKLASEELNVSSTPTFFINGEMVQGSQNIKALSNIIDEQLKKARAE